MVRAERLAGILLRLNRERRAFRRQGMNQEEFDRLKLERAAQENAQYQAQQRLNDYQIWQNYAPNDLSGGGAAAQQINISLENEWAEIFRRMDRLEAEMVESRKVMIELLARLRSSSLPEGVSDV